MEFYRIIDQLDEYLDRWHLGEPVDEWGVEVDARDFTEGRTVSVHSLLRIPQVCPGAPLDFTFAAFDMPVVRREVGELFEQLAGDDVQRIPVQVEGQAGDYEIINIKRRIDCIDENRSHIMKWTDKDGWLEKVGQYRMIGDLHVDANRIENSHVFRLSGWEIALICSGHLKHCLESHSVRGIDFQKV